MQFLFLAKRIKERRGMTLIELLVAMSILGILLFGLSMIYFSCIKTYLKSAWKLPPYDEATLATQDMSRRLREAMLVEDFGSNYLIAVLPAKDANRDNVLAFSNTSASLVVGKKIYFYMADVSGALGTEGHCLWLAEAPAGTSDFVPKKLIGENIHPELNPTDPATGLPKPMFRYYPSETRLYGVEMLVTSTSDVHGELKTQTADAEVYMRNL